MSSRNQTENENQAGQQEAALVNRIVELVCKRLQPEFMSREQRAQMVAKAEAGNYSAGWPRMRHPGPYGFGPDGLTDELRADAQAMQSGQEPYAVQKVREEIGGQATMNMPGMQGIFRAVADIRATWPDAELVIFGTELRVTIKPPYTKAEPKVTVTSNVDVAAIDLIKTIRAGLDERAKIWREKVEAAAKTRCEFKPQNAKTNGEQSLMDLSSAVRHSLATGLVFRDIRWDDGQYAEMVNGHIRPPPRNVSTTRRPCMTLRANKAGFRVVFYFGRACQKNGAQKHAENARVIGPN